MRKTLSVAIITRNEEANLARTLRSVSWADEVVLADSGSTDATLAIARDHNATIYEEAWRGFGVQKNFALAQCSGDWLLSLDADEEVSPELQREIQALLSEEPEYKAYSLPRRNLFLGRWMRHGGYYPDRKLRLFERGAARFEERVVHETVSYSGPCGQLKGDLIHHAYPDLDGYIEHMNRYSTLGAGAAHMRGSTGQGLLSFLGNTVLNPAATFVYNYGLRLGFLDGREGLLLHLYHSAYVSWKYAKAWQLGNSKRD
ncbi:MAG: glycosyltransferase family 2 protein [Acidobacteria bacterium]|nr:glycosyltransferase family 2 protein [Acidobacteriota bacterium]MBW4045720.1 glycosyltransferase family 2 protein [Acidobacteriota bacterium]